VIVGRGAGGLQDEHVLAAHILVNLDHDLTIREAVHHRFTERYAQLGCNASG